MSNIRAIDFAKEVETNRQKLIQHCVANGKIIDNSNSLSEIVDADTQIAEPIEAGKFAISFLGDDGEPVLPTQYVTAGSSVTLPAGPAPSEDADLIEFDQWVASGDTTNVQENIICQASYKTKLDSTLNERPTYYICNFDNNTLSPTFIIQNTPTNTYINWGDGSAAEQISSTTFSHTYATAGLYTITIYGDSYTIARSPSVTNTILQGDYRYCLLKAYCGEHFVYTDLNRALFTQMYSLRRVILPPNTTVLGLYMFYYCYSLDNLVIPKTLTSVGSQGIFSQCRSLRKIILNTTSSINLSNAAQMFQACSGLETAILKSASATPYNGFQDCASLQNVQFPNATSISGNSFLYCRSLKSINIPSSVTSINSDAFSYCFALNNVEIYNNFNTSLNLQYSPLSEECLIDIANKLKDNTGGTAKTLTVHKNYCYGIMNSVYLDSNGDKVPYGTTGAVSLLEFITNKNWTVTFATFSIN